MLLGRHDPRQKPRRLGRSARRGNGASKRQACRRRGIGEEGWESQWLCVGNSRPSVSTPLDTSSGQEPRPSQCVLALSSPDLCGSSDVVLDQMP